MLEKLSTDDLRKLFLYDTLFYKRTNVTSMAGSSVNWTRNVDIFQKDLLLFPMGDDTHWWLMVAVRPGDIASNGTTIVLLDR